MKISNRATVITVVVVALSIAGFERCERAAAVSEADAAKIQLAAGTTLDSIQRAKHVQLQARLDSATDRYNRERADLRRRLASTKPRLDSILISAEVMRVDTVKVPVEVLVETAEAVKGCSLYLLSCENRIAAEQEMRVMAEEQASLFRAERNAALKLIPTARQRTVQNAKVVVWTVGILAVGRGLLGVIR